MSKSGPQPADVSGEDISHLVSVLRELLHDTRADEVSRRTCASVRELLGADGATFVVCEGDQVYYADEDAIDTLWKGRRFPATSCISGWAAIHRQTAVIEDIYADDRIPAAAYRPTFVRSLVVTPMGRTEPLGAMGAYWREGHRATDREVWLLEQLADAAAGAVARLAAPAASPPVDDPAVDGLSTRLLAVVAHDLRGPLGTIKTSTDLLLRSAGEDSQQATISRRIERGAADAARLIDQILDYARLEHGGLSLRLGQVRLDQLCVSLASELGGSEGAVHIEADEVEGLCDGERMAQVIGNLVRNAVQHGDPDQPVVVRIARDGDLGRIVVHNHGPAIPIQDQRFLFEPFRQFSASGERGGSIGLGLYIADQIVRAHGGMLSVDSSDGEGTTFTVTVPLAPVMLERTAAE